ncbi:MAG: PLP-dependent aminotransferase family protein [Actinomycetota bacterium]|nr:PLP-dependent aminotransferase family protein [Actinomycetota bacterium]
MPVKSPPVALSSAPSRIQSSAIRDLLAVTERPGLISLAGGLPAPDTFPVAELAAASASLLADDPGGALQYGPTAGFGPLRDWVAAQEDASPADVVITHGSQQALELLVRVLVDPGDTIALPDPAYVGALQACRLSGADLLAIPTDGDGLRVDVLADHLTAGRRPKLVYVVADLDNPTGATLPISRRRALAELADRYGFVIVDDEPYRALRWSGDEPTPLRALSDRVVTLGTTSKVLSPGLRIGWAVAPPEVHAAMVLLKQAVDLQTATFAQRLAHAVLTRPGFYEPHVDQLRRTYQERAAALTAALTEHVPELAVGTPPGGMFLWGRLPGVDTGDLLGAAVEEGTAFVPGSAFAVDDPATDHLRLSFATGRPAELAEAARRLGRAVKKVTHGGR